MSKHYAYLESLIGQEKNPDKYVCHACPELERFWTARDLTAHQTIHLKAEGRLTCLICLRKITHPRGMKLHLDYKHERLLDKDACLICSLIFVDSSALQVHVEKCHRQDLDRLEKLTGIDTRQDPIGGMQESVVFVLDKLSM
jgi:hypothetical protein